MLNVFPAAVTQHNAFEAERNARAVEETGPTDSQRVLVCTLPL
jgi:hypothetical protein